MRIAYNNLLSILLLSGLLCPLSLFGQDSLNVRKIDQVNLWTTIVGAEVFDETLLLSSNWNTGIIFLDISDPLIPVEVGQFPKHRIYSQIKKYDTRLFFVGSDFVTERLYQVDISDPFEPFEIAFQHNVGSSFDIWGDYLMLVHWEGATLKTYDLLNPDPFTEIESMQMTGTSFVAACGDYVAIARTPFTTLGFYSLSTGNEFQLLDSLVLPDLPLDVETIGDYQLVLCRDGLQLIALSDSGVTLQWFWPLPGNSISLRLDGSDAYVRFTYPSGFTHIAIFDLTNPLEPDSIGNFRAYGAANFFDVEDNIAYVPQIYPDYAVIKYDVTNPDTVVRIGRVDQPGPATNLALLDTLLYSGYGEQPSGIWDVSTPVETPMLGRAFSSDGSYETHIANGHAYIAGGDYLWVYDMTDPLAPAFEGNGEPYGWPECAGPGVIGCTDGIYGKNQLGQDRYRELANVKNLEIYDSIMVVSANGINILENIEWQTIGYIATPSWDVRKRGGIIYSASNTAGLKVIDATDLSNPVLINSIPIEGETRQLELQDNILMTCSRSGGVRFWDVSIPELPQLIGMYESGNSAEDVVLIDTVAYVADYYKLTVLDVSDALALAGPPRPQGLAIVAVSDSLYFSWRQARNATSYRLWSSVDAALPEDLYTLAVSTSDTLAVLPLGGESRRFFFVTAIRE